MLYMGLGTSCQHCTKPSPKKLFCIIRSESYIEASKSVFMFGCENFSVYVHITVIAALTKICCLFAFSFSLSSSSISHLPPYFFCCMISVIPLGFSFSTYDDDASGESLPPRLGTFDSDCLFLPARLTLISCSQY